MIRFVFGAAVAASVAAVHLAPSAAAARNTPCSQSKGGVKACQGDKYLCNDGSISSSKTKCSGK